MKERTILLGVAIRPPIDVCRAAIATSRRLKSRGGLFVLDNKNFYPHITLYLAEFPARNLKEIKASLRRLFRNQKLFRAAAVRYGAGANSYIDVGYKKSREIALLQKKIIQLLNPLRGGLICNTNGMKFDAARLRNFELYGYDGVFGQFRPHLTFTRLRRGGRNPDFGIPPGSFSFTADKAALFFVGRYFTCRKMAEVFRFRRNMRTRKARKTRKG